MLLKGLQTGIADMNYDGYISGVIKVITSETHSLPTYTTYRSPGGIKYVIRVALGSGLIRISLLYISGSLPSREWCAS